MPGDPRPAAVLLVEDTSDDERLTVRALKRVGLNLEVRIARDGAEALEMLFGNGSNEPPPALPNLILLDLKLPKVNGLEVLQAIRDHESTELLPVVVLTSSDEQRDLVACYHRRCNAYVRKAVDYTEYMDTMQKTLEFWLGVNRTPSRLADLAPVS
ncbi:MAG TPA: response regulator [Fimbriimonas sp.]|nr:response regulator [Fimbriimonas sp.]